MRRPCWGLAGDLQQTSFSKQASRINMFCNAGDILLHKACKLMVARMTRAARSQLLDNVRFLKQEGCLVYSLCSGSELQEFPSMYEIQTSS